MKNLSLPKLFLHLGLLSLISISFYTPVAEAKYRPKKVGRYRGATIPTGTRSACDGTKTADRLTPIAPFSHIGQTAIPTPTVTWFVPEQTPRTLILRLWDDTTPIWETTLQSQFGLMSHPLPKLQPDRPYRWQLVLVCKPNSPSLNQVTDAPIVYTPLKAPFPTVSTLAAQVEQRTNAELWYDALDLARTDPKLYPDLITDLQTIETDALQTLLQTEPIDPEQTDALKQHLTNLNRLLSF